MRILVVGLKNVECAAKDKKTKKISTKISKYRKTKDQKWTLILLFQGSCVIFLEVSKLSLSVLTGRGTECLNILARNSTLKCTHGISEYGGQTTTVYDGGIANGTSEGKRNGL